MESHTLKTKNADTNYLALEFLSVKNGNRGYTCQQVTLKLLSVERSLTELCFLNFKPSEKSSS